MNQTDPDDQRFDDLLRDLGPEVPMPVLGDDDRARIMGVIDGGAPAVPSGRLRRSRLLIGIAALAASLGLACVWLWIDLGRAQAELSASEWRTDEVLQLLVSARHVQRPVPVPGDLADVKSADLVLITFHHELCPIARTSTPGFRSLVERHTGSDASFITFDVTGSKREAVAREIEGLDLRFALLGPLGAETGVVKVIDTAHRRVLSAAPGRLGLEQAEQLLSMVAEAEHG